MRYLKKLAALFVMIMTFAALTATVSANGGPSKIVGSMADETKVKITGGDNYYTGAGKVGPGAFTVKYDGVVLKQDVDYRVISLEHTKAGLYKAIIRGLGPSFTEERLVYWNLKDATGSKKASIRYKKGTTALVHATAGLGKDKLLTLEGSKIKEGNSYKFKITASKKGYEKYIKTNRKTGRVRVKKGIKAGVYKVKITVYRGKKKVGTQTIKITIK